MSLDEFLEQLSKTPRDWILLSSTIRRPRGPLGYYVCPIIAVVNDLDFNNGTASTVGRIKLNLSRADVNSIIGAADSCEGDARDPVLRQELLEACGLPAEEW